MTKTFLQIKEEVTSENTVSAILNDCRPFLNEIQYFKNRGGLNLYRGMKSNQTFERKETRFNRVPYGMDNEKKEVLDDVMMQKFGYPFRTKVAFVSGDPKHVELFGNVFVVFPIGKYTYLWSPEVFDINLDSNFNAILDVMKKKEEWKNDLLSYVEEKNYMKDQGLEKAAEMGNEVMLGAEEYYAIEKGFFVREVKSPLLQKLREET